MRTPTGELYELELPAANGRAASRARIGQLAAALQEFSVRGMDVVEPVPPTGPPPSAAGLVLVPWPNRVKDGAWVYTAPDGRQQRQQLDLTEPARGNAIHGLLRHTPYLERERTGSSVVLEAPVYPQAGYPFWLDTSVEYALTATGLEVTHRIVNRGEVPAPVAVGAHPYLRIAELPTDSLKLTVYAQTHFEVDDRLNVVSEHPVEGTPFDLRTPHSVGELQLDDGFGQAGQSFEGGLGGGFEGGLEGCLGGGRLSGGGSVPGGGFLSDADSAVQDASSTDPDASSSNAAVKVLATLAAPDGRRVTLWGDASLRYVQVFTSRSFATHSPGELALAVEPMTAPANALNTGQGLHWLDQGQEWIVRWGITPAF